MLITHTLKFINPISHVEDFAQGASVIPKYLSDGFEAGLARLAIHCYHEAGGDHRPTYNRCSPRHQGQNATENTPDAESSAKSNRPGLPRVEDRQCFVLLSKQH